MRYADRSYDQADHLDRGVDDALWMRSDAQRAFWPLVTICDVELGQRASEALDMLEDEHEITWRAEEAYLEALYQEESAQ